MNHRIVIPHGDVLNSYLALLRSAMERSGFVVEHLDPPWSHTPDITWIHWPEAMFGWREPERAEVARFEEWIRRCAGRGLVLWTVHNAFPHAWGRSRRYRDVYRLVAESAQIHLHHGTSSIREIEKRYPSAHPLITRTYPHGGYWQLIGDLTPEAARDQLGLTGRGRILLVFGEVRGLRELRLVFRATRARGWYVLLVGRLRSRRKSLWLLINILTRLGPTKRWRLITGSVPDEQVDAYVKAADAVFIPRYEVLNSGNVFLGFTFGKPVIGPNVGNVGELLSLTRNPTFDPKDTRSIARALAALSSEEMASLGRRNAAWLQQNGQWDQAAAAVRQAVEEGSRLRSRGGAPVDREGSA